MFSCEAEDRKDARRLFGGFAGVSLPAAVEEVRVNAVEQMSWWFGRAGCGQRCAALSDCITVGGPSKPLAASTTPIPKSFSSDHNEETPS